MTINNDTEETKKLKELFYTAEKENIQLAFTIAVSTDNQQFWNFYQQWLDISNFMTEHHPFHFEESVNDILNSIKKNNFSLSNLKIQTLPDCFSVIADICTSIDLQGCNLTEIPEAIKNFIYLENLYLSDNQLQVLPDWLFELKNLKCIDLDNNFIEYLSEDVKFLQNLEMICCVQNTLCKLPKNLACLPKLQNLSYCAQDINTEKNSFPAPILACKNLKYLSIHNLYLDNIPEQFTNLIQLESVVFWDCKIENKVVGFDKLPNLWELCLIGNYFTKIPAHKQVEIPAEIKQLRNLKSLCLYLRDAETFNESIEFWKYQLPLWLPNTQIKWDIYEPY